MNLIGAGLRRLAEGMGFGDAQCILVFDDLALPLGTVKARQRGGAGGHRGVASILSEFQTDTFRRIKVGVGPLPATLAAGDYVLAPFDASAQAVVAEAISWAEQRVSELVHEWRGHVRH